MKVVADEEIDRDIVISLRHNGFDVLYVAETGKATPDPDVLGLSVSTSALLLTQDKDFGELVFRQSKASFGVLLVRLNGLTGPEKAVLVSRTLIECGADLPGAFSVLSEKSLRIRRI